MNNITPVNNFSYSRSKINRAQFTKMLMLIFLCGCLSSFSYNIILRNYVYPISLCIEVIFLFVFVVNNKVGKFESKILIALALMILLRVIFIQNSNIMYSINSIVQLCTIGAIILCHGIFKIDESVVSFYNKLLLVLCILGLWDYFLSADKIVFEIFGSMNTLAGVFAFLLSVDIVLVQYKMKKWYLLNMFVCVVLIFLSTSRTPLLMIASFILCWFILKKFFTTKKSQVVLLFAVIAIIAAFIYLYINVDKWPFYEEINLLSQKYFGKNINSGRPTIWKETLSRIAGNWLFGVGSIEHAYGNSGHNQYIQLLGDNGVIGLVLLIVLFALIWIRFARYGRDKIVRVCMALMLSFIIYNCFEVTLLQNKFALGCLEWMVISIGLNRCGYIQHKNKITNNNL